MRFDFKEFPGASGGVRRPIVPVVVEGLVHAPQPGLVDTGSVHNRFAAWIARTAGIDLRDASEEVIGVGGFTSVARTVPVRLAVAGFEWEAPVSFCDPWPLDFQLLGQEGFFRWFEVTIRAAHLSIDLEPEER